MNARTKKIHALLDKYGENMFGITSDYKLFRRDNGKYVFYDSNVDESHEQLCGNMSEHEYLAETVSIFDYSPRDFIASCLICANIICTYYIKIKVDSRYIYLYNEYFVTMIIDTKNFTWRLCLWGNQVYKTYRFNKIDKFISYFSRGENYGCVLIDDVGHDLSRDNFDTFDGTLFSLNDCDIWKYIQKILNVFEVEKIPKIACWPPDVHILTFE